MSGLYDSYVVVDERAERLLLCRRVLAEGRQTAITAEATATEVVAQISAADVRDRGLAAQSATLIARAQSLRTHVRATGELIASLEAPVSYLDTSVSELDLLIAKSRELEATLAADVDQARGVERDHAHLLGADERVVQARKSLSDATSAVQVDKQLLEAWTPDEAVLLSEQLADVTRDIASMRRGTEDSSTTEIDEAMSSASEQCARIRDAAASAGAKARKLQEADERRRYLANALIDVCVQLGFEQLAEMQHEDPADPTSDLVLRFDTLDKGVVVFKLGMDEKVITDSAIEESYCGTEFDRLSEALAATYGVQANFAAQQGTPRPTRRTNQEAHEAGSRQGEHGV